VALLRAAAFAVAVAITTVTVHGSTASEHPDEYSVKAAFLLNFARLVAWPDSAFAAPDEPLVVGVLGEQAYRSALEAGIDGERVGRRTIRLERLSEASRAARCHLVFVSRGMDATGLAVLAASRGRPVLTVGESAGFARAGGVIGFYEQERKVRFEINPDAAERAEIRISSRLLRLARIVAERPS
jgi:hypothetical protein